MAAVMMLPRMNTRAGTGVRGWISTCAVGWNMTAVLSVEQVSG